MNAHTKISQSFRDELLGKIDLVELIDGYIPLKKQGQSFTACCPFHNEKTPSFNVIAKKQFYYCFGCKASGNAISFIMNYLHQGFLEAIETLASRVGMKIPRDNSDRVEHTLSLSQLLQKIARFYQQALRQSESAIHYLQCRGVSGEIAKRYQLGYAHAGWNTLEAAFKQHKSELIASGMVIKKENGNRYDRYRDRIMFPIHDRHGHMIGFGGRALSSDQKPKYLNSPETSIFQKNRELYGLYQLLQEKKSLPIDYILIVEGYLDVIALAQYGIDNAVAALGTATSTYHIQLLSKYTKQLIFCFDGDLAGRQAAWKALESSMPHLDQGLDVRFIFLPENEDPDSFVRQQGAEELRRLIKRAVPLNEYFFQVLTEKIDLQSAAGKSQLINASEPFLKSMPDSSYKQLIINDLSRITKIENHRIERIIASSYKQNPEKKIAQSYISRSPIRLVIALLIQHPELYALYKQHVPTDEHLSGKGLEILQSLIQVIAKNPAINTATLIEHWRDTPLFNSLLKLAAWEHNVPEHALEKEFLDTIYFLYKKETLENKINKYIAKSKNQGLTTSERILLQDLIKRQHLQIAHDEK